MIGSIKVTISPDKTKAFLSLIRPPSAPKDARNDYAELVSALASEHRLTHLDEGALARVIDDFNERGLGCTDVLIADTKQPITPGANGYLEWLVAEDPELPEDSKGRVNFYDFSALKNVGEGEYLAVLHPPKPGKAGLSVTGEVITPPAYKEVNYIAGENVEYRPDTGEFIALRSGRVELRGGTVIVSKLYEVEGDVDFSTGNLNFDGFIRVRGNVQDNFRINAIEGVQIDKVIGAATVESGGTITVMGGINCRNKGIMRCEGDLISRFLNNAEVWVKGSIKVEKEILNCKVYAGTVGSLESTVSGGEMIAIKDIEIREAGSAMGVRTVIQAGRDIFAEKQIEEQERLVQKDKELVEGLLSRVDAVESVKSKVDPEIAKAIEGMKARATMLKESVDARTAEIEAKKKATLSLDATVTIHRAVHPGVVIRIGKYEKSLNQKFEGYRRFAFDKKNFEIVMHYE